MRNQSSFILAAIPSILLMVTSSAFATQLTLYGQIDTGISLEKGKGSNPSVKSAGSADIPSKWGIMGKEDLGGNNYVKFNLENGFNPFNGTQTWGYLFGREALVMIGGSWGELALGRTGTFFGSIGSYGMWAKMGINPMQTNFGDSTLGGVFTSTGMASNSITYQFKPNSFWTFTAQYLNGDDDSNGEWDQHNHLYEGAIQFN
ncbi:MAG: porin, partial [Sutterellaceae bacterium]|nr:porin [Sutterellaceae bacterium]